ncbi:UbiA prenyltransferase family-domain-containing protein [Ephemerocybe angulata]|uniref:UbiA prenyltransferase family-domain-containing protein n=1 Tax=Ephemerocybe angulata TaxID=980116 RepID=A0A8H6LVN9_9AGAR|nr:UbiA prenyltransferase family-domain-containing protein [Tulosesus angulatus]
MRTPSSSSPMLSSASRFFSWVDSFPKSLAYHLETCFLFTKSDIKTIIVPVSILGIGTAPLCRSQPVEHSLQAIFWLWIVLLQANLSNQTSSPEEDAGNKPWRPIPAGRISLRNAVIAHRISIPACALLSLYFSPAVLVSCLLFTFFLSLHNDFDGAKNGFAKSLLNGFGYIMLALGTTLIAGCDRESDSLMETLHWKNFPELTIFFFVIITTIHAQDFQDVEGDREVGRNTIPMILPEISRISMPILLPFWSVIIVFLCNPPALLGSIFVAFSMIIGFRFLLMRKVKEDEISYFLYNVSAFSTKFPDHLANFRPRLVRLGCR